MVGYLLTCISELLFGLQTHMYLNFSESAINVAGIDVRIPEMEGKTKT